MHTASGGVARGETGRPCVSCWGMRIYLEPLEAKDWHERILFKNVIFGSYVQDRLKVNTAHMREKSEGAITIILMRNYKELNKSESGRMEQRDWNKRYLGNRETVNLDYWLKVKVLGIE